MGKKVAAVVLNSVSNDIRVLKEAESLQKAGFSVTLFGLRLGPNDRHEETLSSGVRVVRLNYHRVRNQLIFAIVLFLMVWLCLDLFVVLSGIVGGTMSPFQLPVHFAMFAGLFFIVLMMSEKFRRLFPFFRSSRFEKSRINQLIEKARFVLVNKSYELTFAKKILEEQPDIVQAHDLSALPIAAVVKKKSKCKLVYDSHEIFEDMADKKAWEKEKYEEIQSRLSESVDAFITINDSIAKHLKEKYPSLPPASIVKNASIYKPETMEATYDRRLHQKAGLNLDMKIALYQGGFSKGRGLEALVKSAAHFPDNWRLVLMGGGSLQGHLEDLSKKSNKAIIIPKVPQDQLAHWSKGASVGLIPYINSCLNHWYCSPNKLWEYPRSGVPIVASDFPELRAVVENHQLGWLIEDFENEKELPSLLAKLNSDEIQSRRDKGADFIKSDNWQKYEKVLVSAFENLD